MGKRGFVKSGRALLSGPRRLVNAVLGKIFPPRTEFSHSLEDRAFFSIFVVTEVC